MARLNDPPPPPAESIDALKRRFIRQNREIARVNSNQSQRIRNLESEISRLVAENISLREQIIAAQAETQRWKRTNTLSREILDVKERLDRKMREVSDLIGEMGDLPEKVARRASSRRKSTLPSTTRTMSEEEYKNRLAMKEALARERQDPAIDGRLPSIHEDKLFPRRTLESAEMIALRDEAALQDSTESPDLGPPPVAHFDVQDPIKFDAEKQANSESGEEVVQLPSTLEKRRKRRTSALLHDMPTETEQVELQVESSTVPPLLKAGAKRKLDASDLESPVVKSSSSENDDFVFQRRQEAGTGKKSSRFSRPPGRDVESTAETNIGSPQKVNIETRRILAPKSTNSPAKRKVVISDGKPEYEKSDRDTSAPVKPSKRSQVISQIIVQPSASELPPADEIEPQIHPPKTPASLPDDILSPISTEPSVRNLHKEAAVLNSVEDVLNGSIGRGSRRARAAVSYAEPNLRDKMRRPGKELVGAVEGIEKKDKDSTTLNSHSRTTSLERARSESENDGPQHKVERNEASENRWKGLPLAKSEKDEPASPLRDKERKENNVRDRSNGSTVEKDSRSNQHQPSHHHSQYDQTDYGDELEKAVDRLSIFDPPSSSPMAKEERSKDASEAGTVIVNSSTSTSKRRASSTSNTSMVNRRHSMQPISATALNTTGTTSQIVKGPGRPSSAASLRNDSSSASSRIVVHNPTPNTSTNSTSATTKELKRSASVTLNNRSSQNASRNDARTLNSTDQVETRAERTASRRRSMMV